MKGKRIRAVVLALFIFAILVLFCLVVSNKSLKKDTLSQEKYLKSNKIFLDGNLLVKRGFFKNKNIALPGFETNIKSCDFPGVEYLKQNDIACFLGFVGAHSQNIVLVSIPDFRIMKFYNNTQISSNIYSDVPMFEVKNESDQLKLEVLYRDYDKDPTADQLEKSYLFRLNR